MSAELVKRLRQYAECGIYDAEAAADRIEELERELERLRRINSQICDDKNTLLVEGAKLERQLAAAPSPSGKDAQPWHKQIEGVSVSMDVSTGEYDSYNRIYGRVIEVMTPEGGNGEYTILAEETSRNFGGKDAQEAKDAARYRHLRNVAYNGFPMDGPDRIGHFEVKQKIEPGHSIYWRGAALDEAVDKAIAALSSTAKEKKE